jgi:hypothetical protein
LEEAEAHSHIDSMQSLCKLDAYSPESRVFMGVALDGILGVT